MTNDKETKLFANAEFLPDFPKTEKSNNLRQNSFNGPEQSSLKSDEDGLVTNEAKPEPADVTENLSKNFISTNVEELMSDGSASAFEGTESIDSHEEDLNFERKAEQLKNDPSGRSNY